MKKLLSLALIAFLATANVNAAGFSNDKKCDKECCAKCDDKCKEACKGGKCEKQDKDKCGKCAKSESAKKGDKKACCAKAAQS